MNKTLIALGVAAVAAMPALAMQQASAPPAAPAKGSVAAPSRPHMLMLFENTNYAGDSVEVEEARPSVRTMWNIRSISVHPGEAWQICARSRYRDPCIILNRSVHDATLIGIEGQVGSIRPASEVPIPD